jgi:hypothetical protein
VRGKELRGLELTGFGDFEEYPDQPILAVIVVQDL